MNAILHGVMLAFLILPLGAQNVFIFQQGAWQNMWQAFPAVIAAAVCDTILIIAVAGVSMIIAEIPVFQTVMLIGGFCFSVFRLADLEKQTA